jgi:uncharacterized protein (TIGR02646 family)
MKRIEKGKEPKSLTEQRAKSGDYNGLAKNELQNQLKKEQGGICCYCMRRIPQKLKPEDIDKHYPSCKIEHVLSQENHPDQQLNYQNMLLACNGNHGQPEKVQTCDTFKGKKDFHFNPAGKRNIEELIKYNGLGEIYSDDEQLKKELDDVLNLNTYDLKRIRAERYKFYDSKVKRIGDEYKGKKIPRNILEAKKQDLLTKNGGKFDEYCMVGVYLLNKKLKRL